MSIYIFFKLIKKVFTKQQIDESGATTALDLIKKVSGIDYYQSGLSLQVEAILRGKGYLKTFPLDSAIIIYDNLSELQKR